MQMLRSLALRRLAGSSVLSSKGLSSQQVKYLHSSQRCFNNKSSQREQYDEAQLFSDRLTKQEYFAKRPPHESDPSERPATEAEMTKYKKLEGLTGVLTGLVGISLLLIGFTAYQKRANIKNWYYNTDNIDDGFEYKPLKKKKIQYPEIVNKNDSSVPGLYLCGDNSNYIVNPKKSVREQRFPLRHEWFDNKRLLKVELGAESALAIDSDGNLIQWGKGFNPDSSIPEITVKGEHFIDAKLSNGMIYALNKKHDILLIPENKKNQNDFMDFKKGWFKSSYKPKKLSLDLLSKGEKIVDIQTGLSHLVVLTNKGKTYTSATGLPSQKPVKSLGQFGLPEFSQFQNAPSPNKLYEITLLNNEITHSKTKTKNPITKIIPREIKQIATGNNHTLALDSNGEVYSFGSNTYGQLCQPVSYDSEIIPFPKKITLIGQSLRRDQFAKADEIHVGGDTSFVKVRPTKMYRLVRTAGNINNNGDDEDDDDDDAEDDYIVGFGNNLKGQLGTNHFIHAQYTPLKIQTLTKFQDFNESTQMMEKIPIKSWSSSPEHTFIKLANNDVLYWGSNDHGELGNGKKSRLPKPEAPPALLEPGVDYTQLKKDWSFSNRLQVKDSMECVAGIGTSGIYYKPVVK